MKICKLRRWSLSDLRLHHIQRKREKKNNWNKQVAISENNILTKITKGPPCTPTLCDWLFLTVFNWSFHKCAAILLHSLFRLCFGWSFLFLWPWTDCCKLGKLNQLGFLGFKINTLWFLYFLCYIAKVLYGYFFEIVVFYNDTDVIPIEFYTVVVFWEIIYMFLYVYNYMFFNLDVLAKDLSVCFFHFCSRCMWLVQDLLTWHDK